MAINNPWEPLTAKDMEEIAQTREALRFAPLVLSGAELQGPLDAEELMRGDLQRFATALENEGQLEHAAAVGEVEDVLGVLLEPGEPFPGSVKEAMDIKRRRAERFYRTAAEAANMMDQAVEAQRRRGNIAMWFAALASAALAGLLVGDAVRWLR